MLLFLAYHNVPEVILCASISLVFAVEYANSVTW